MDDWYFLKNEGGPAMSRRMSESIRQCVAKRVSKSQKVRTQSDNSSGLVLTRERGARRCKECTTPQAIVVVEKREE